MSLVNIVVIAAQTEPRTNHIDKTAQAKVGAEAWTVKSDKAPLLKGTKVKVLAIEGVKLIVEPVTE